MSHAHQDFLNGEYARASLGVERFYCPTHRYNPPANSGFAFCPKCEEREQNEPNGVCMCCAKWRYIPPQTHVCLDCATYEPE